MYCPLSVQRWYREREWPNKLIWPSGSARAPIAQLLSHFEAGSLASGRAKRYFLPLQVMFFTGLIREGGMTMPAKEPPGLLLSAEPSPTHTWSKPQGRRLELEPGKPLIQWSCTTCQRHFVNEPATGDWYAAFPRMLDFERLDSVSEQWLSEDCPGRQLASDQEARKPGRH
jgi:hypothetical protein